MKAIVLALVLLVAGATAAGATCLTAPFERVLNSSNTVWWVKVTGSQPSRAAPRGEVLDVTINDALKGPGKARAAGLVFLNSCGRYMTAAGEKQMAQSLVGRSFLFMGTYTNGVLSPDPTIVTPAGMSEQEKYDRAVADLGLLPGLPARLAPPWHRWVLVLIVGVVVALIVCAVFLMRTRTERSPPSTSAKGGQFGFRAWRRP